MIVEVYKKNTNKVIDIWYQIEKIDNQFDNDKFILVTKGKKDNIIYNINDVHLLIIA